MKRKTIILSNDILYGKSVPKRKYSAGNSLMDVAAVLGTFSLEEVGAWPVTGSLDDQIEELESNSRIINSEKDEPIRILKESTRIACLQKFLRKENATEQLKKIEAIEGLSDNALFNIKFLQQEAKPIDQQSLDELTQTFKIANWVAPLNLNYPEPEDVYAQMRRQELIQPFHELTLNFEGRDKELSILKDYVDWLPKEGLVQRTTDFFRKVTNWHKKKPLLITGIGGIGKSTLVARFILEHLEDSNKLPFVYIDFDRPSYSISEPLFVLAEAFEQLKVQFPKLEKVFDRLLEAMEDLVFNKRRTDNKDKSNESFRQKIYKKLLRHLSQFEIAPADIKQPVLAVFDSFEELQYRGANKSEFHTFLETIQEISAMIPRIRPVFVGRSEIEFKEVSFETIKLSSFDEKSALAYLQKLGIKYIHFREKIFQNFGGNPLTLQLAAALARQVGIANSKALDNVRTGMFFQKLDDASIQRELVIRNLDHIHDAEVRKIAVPGLLVRRVNAAIIQAVLAGPCGLGEISLKKAEAIFESLKRETFLIQSSSLQSKTIVFRADLRKAMEGMILKQNPFNAQLIHDNAVTYYKDRKPAPDQAEYVYHLLKGGADPNFLSLKQYNRISKYLDQSLEELSLEAQVHIAGLRGSKISTEKLQEVKLEEWEQYLTKIIRDGLKADRKHLEVLLKDVKLRKERSFNSPLHYWEARLYQRLDKINRSDKVIDKALEEIITYDTPEDRERHIRLIITQIENREYQFDFEKAFELLQTFTFEMVTQYDPFILFQLEVLHTRLTTRLGLDKSNWPETEISALDFEKNDTYKSYQSYSLIDLNDNKFPFNTLPKKDFLKEFKNFRSSYPKHDALEDFTGQFLGLNLSGLSEPGYYELVVKDVFHRTNKNILDQIKQVDTSVDARKLVRVLANLYPNIEASLRLLDHARIYSKHISFQQSAISNWVNILRELEKSDNLTKLLEQVLKEYPGNKDIRDELRQRTLKAAAPPVDQKIIEKLADLFPTIASSRLLLKAAGVDNEQIIFDKKAIKNWQNIIANLKKEGTLNMFFQLLVEQYDDDGVFLRYLKEETSIILLDDASKVLQEEVTFDKKELEELIIRGNLKGALEKLSSLSVKRLKNDILLFQSRLARLEQDDLRGIISADHYSRERNRIVMALFALITDAEKELDAPQIAPTTRNIGRGITGLNVPEKEVFDRIRGNGDKIAPINWLSRALEVSKSVCKVEQADQAMGTGFLVKGGYLLTSHHLFPIEIREDNVRLIFDFKPDEDGVIYQIDPAHTYIKNPDLDYILVKVKDNPKEPLAQWGHVEMEKAANIPQLNDLISIIQHPEGGHLKIAMPDTVISIWEEKNFLFYQADTRRGSSGSPVFNQTWKVVALHQAGVYEKDGGMQINAEGDRRAAKRGILIWPILEDLKAKGIEL